MEDFLKFFEHISTTQKAMILGAAISGGLILESLAPLFKFDYKRLKHIGVNFVFLSFTLVINFLFALGAIPVFEYMAANELGLLHLFALPVWVELVIALLLFDFIAQFGVHYILHKNPFLWKFHMIHHSDTHVDTTTGTRHHPGDYLMREVFALIAVLLTGAPFAFYMVYRVLTIPFTYLTHANINVPIWLDKPLSYIFVTPNVHKFHHHNEMPWTDTNFGNILSVWDRIFGTFVYDDPQKINYGLDVLEGRDDESIPFQLGIPFDKSVPTRGQLLEERSRASA